MSQGRSGRNIFTMYNQTTHYHHHHGLTASANGDHSPVNLMSSIRDGFGSTASSVTNNSDERAKMWEKAPIGETFLGAPGPDVNGRLYFARYQTARGRVLMRFRDELFPKQWKVLLLNYVRWDGLNLTKYAK